MGKQYHPKVIGKNNGSGFAYYLDYKDAAGKRKTAKAHDGYCDCRTKRCVHSLAADKVLADYLAKQEELAETGYKDMTVAKWKTLYESELETSNKEESTQNTYKHTLRLFTNFCADTGVEMLSQITFETVDDFRVAIAAGNVRSQTRKANSGGCNMHMRNLQLIFNRAIRKKRMKDNPIFGNRSELMQEIDERKNFLTPDEIQKIKDMENCLFKQYSIFAMNTGMRISEILSLKWNDIVNDVIVMESYQGRKIKDKEKRIVPLNKAATEVIEQRKTTGIESEYVFHTSNGTAYSKTNMLRYIRQMVAELGLKGHHADMGVSSHTIGRHTFGSVLVNDKNVPITVVKELLNHSDIRLTQMYSQVAERHLKDAVDSLD